jgi:hypothetical protein
MMMIAALVAGCAETDVANVEQAVSAACGFANAAWDFAMLPQQSGQFTLTFYAQATDPNNEPIDAVVGLSNGRADAFSDLAAIVRFNSGGRIDVRNGAAYMADVDYAYRATDVMTEDPVSYYIRMDVDIPGGRYSVWVNRDGEAPVRIAGSYAFRVEQAGVLRLDTLNGFRDSANGGAFWCDGRIAPSICRTASPGAGWTNTAFPRQTGEFYVEIDAMAHTDHIDGVVGLSSAGASGFGDLATIVRFNPDGYFDARDGDTYRAEMVAPYVPGVMYTILFWVDVPSRTYTAAVYDPSRGVQPQIASWYRFRTEQQSATSLANLGQLLDVPYGHLTTCDLVQGNFPL